MTVGIVLATVALGLASAVAAVRSRDAVWAVLAVAAIGGMAYRVAQVGLDASRFVAHADDLLTTVGLVLGAVSIAVPVALPRSMGEAGEEAVYEDGPNGEGTLKATRLGDLAERTIASFPAPTNGHHAYRLVTPAQFGDSGVATPSGWVLATPGGTQSRPAADAPAPLLVHVASGHRVRVPWDVLE